MNKEQAKEQFEKDKKLMIKILGKVCDAIMSGDKRYSNTFRKYGNPMNFYNIARKFIRLENKFHYKITWESLKGDTLLDVYIDNIVYSIFGIILGIEENEIDINDILKGEHNEEKKTK